MQTPRSCLLDRSGNSGVRVVRSGPSLFTPDASLLATTLGLALLLRRAIHYGMSFLLLCLSRQAVLAAVCIEAGVSFWATFRRIVVIAYRPPLTCGAPIFSAFASRLFPTAAGATFSACTLSVLRANFQKTTGRENKEVRPRSERYQRGGIDHQRPDNL